MTNFDLIFDNGGGITLQTADYCHHFVGDEKDVAQHISNILSGEDPSYWDGNEPDCRVDYDYDTERNGGYHWVSDNDVLDAVGQMPVEDREKFLGRISGYAEREFFEALFDIRDRLALQQ